jgi:hypothetical protein
MVFIKAVTKKRQPNRLHLLSSFVMKRVIDVCKGFQSRLKRRPWE